MSSQIRSIDRPDPRSVVSIPAALSAFSTEIDTTDPGLADAGAGIRRTRTARRRRTEVVCGATVLILLGFLAYAVLVGDRAISVGEAARALLGGGSDIDRLVVIELRLPVALAAVLVGAALGLAGALFQSALRNPLASPDLLGIGNGASLGAVIALLMFSATGSAVAVSALAGAGVVAGLIWALAWRSGMRSARFVLVGVGLAYFCMAGVSWMLTRADLRMAQQALGWLVGSVGNVTLGQVGGLSAAMVVLLPLATLLAPRLRLLVLGDDHCRALGCSPNRLMLGVIAVGVALVACATAVAGPVAFVALTAPAIARRLVGGVALVPAALIGAAATLVGQVVGAHLLPGGMTAPVGILTGIAGAPYLLWLLARRGRGQVAV